MAGDDDERGGTAPPEELFGAIGNETRMGILEALWEEFSFDRYVVRAQEGRSFSELVERVGAEDTGNFNYHLRQLTGTLLESRPDGYVLTSLGYNLMRSITTYASYDYRTVEPTDLDRPCPFCGGVLVAKYERELVNVSCRDCGGLGSGNINYVHSPATDGKGLDLHGLLDAATVQLMDRVRASTLGLCGRCHGRVDRSVEHCENHDREADGTCGTCNARFPAYLHVECPHCGSGGHGPLVECAIVSARVQVFFERHDLGPSHVRPWHYRLACLEAVEESLDGASPTGAVYEFAVRDDAHRVRVAERPDGVVVEPARSA